MQPQTIRADLARKEDTDKILEINRLEYGSKDILITRADFAWRHDQNPAGQAIIPILRDSADSVVGFISLLPLRIRVHGQNYLAATGTNMVIHPAHRNTFGYTKLMRKFDQVLKEHSIPLHFSFVSEENYQQRRARMPQTVSTIPLLVKPLDVKTLAQAYFAREPQRFITRTIGRLVSPLIFRRQAVPSDKEIAIQVLDQFTSDFDEFWREIRDKYPVMTVRDQAFLAWRFAPVAERCYHTLVARAQGRMLGYVVLRCALVRGVKTGLIMDFLVTDGVQGQVAGDRLLTEAETFFRTQQMSLTAGLAVPFAQEYRGLRRAGYVRLPQALAPQASRFAIFIHETNNKSFASLSAQDWFISIADYESF